MAVFKKIPGLWGAQEKKKHSSLCDLAIKSTVYHCVIFFFFPCLRTRMRQAAPVAPSVAYPESHAQRRVKKKNWSRNIPAAPLSLFQVSRPSPPLCPSPLLSPPFTSETLLCHSLCSFLPIHPFSKVVRERTTRGLSHAAHLFIYFFLKFILVTRVRTCI